MSLLIRLLVAVIAFVLIYMYLLPLLPAPFNTIVLVVLVLAAIIFLIDLAGYPVLPR